MNNSHPTDREIQDFVVNTTGNDPETARHLMSCERCRHELQNYRLLFTEIKKLPEPEFDFDLSALVIQQLPKTSRRLSVDDIVAGFLVIFVSCCIATPLYVFQKNILGVFADIPPEFVYAIIISTSLYLAIKILFLFKKYQAQMRFLNFN